ncbi:hypothetical protein P153DRAFT_404285 [Dothidotthia symphoricarpi CBS 119687]|uniref:Peptidase M12A domain-containing protein n=1 Tax=Dothidotthia symphoricarpi CBS 119687 TaxID=1392245 RepID=A0A6A6A8X7_9PLEO|nr:uncharacterized protein P153DRAFT_404285 [Dothidotthia symphoricarpi CBS 119687]KAF2128289.1 hypothetical protein P153DRAFT_404285 [Dothidotthia symphoricarpi CBS 119687]
MTIDLTKTPLENAAFQVAHEFGHVFGLWRVHQREDRDNWFYFDCKNLVGYERTKIEVERDGRVTMDQVCDSPFLSYKYGFLAAAWSKHDYVDDKDWQWRLHTGPFDVKSIV